ncbi:MAG: nitroreductase [Alphaproteobacteria bacterium]|nr:nitroreductase [Alphaproteobacteria bacterium]
MDVTQALNSRITCRAFLDTPVSAETVRAILKGATRAPSGGNLQPQHVWALAGADLKGLTDQISRRIRNGEISDGPTEYNIFPTAMKEPYLSRRWQVGADMYTALNVTRLDVEEFREQLVRNYQFFGAPVGLFFAIDRNMQQGQWSDLGMYIMAVMLLAREHGLHTAPLEAWAMFPRTVQAYLKMPSELMLFCGMALGVMDEAHRVNRWRARRAELSEFAHFRGFEPMTAAARKSEQLTACA